MKHLNAISNTKQSKRDLWETPEEFMTVLKNVLRIKDFDLDPCSTRKNKKALYFFDERINGLDQNWAIKDHALVFVNPPFSQMSAWVDKAVCESTGSNITIALLHSDSYTIRDTAWYKKIEKHATHQLLPSKRLNYINPESGAKSSGVSFYSVVSIFSHLPKESLQKIRIFI